MIIWGAILIPIITAIILLLFFNKKVNWIELVLLLVIPIIIIISSKVISVQSRQASPEYWGGYTIEALYYESWDEWINETCSYTVTDSKGNSTTYYYDCSHSVNHPAYYIVNGNNGESIDISREEYYLLVKKFGNEERIELNRNFYTKDGDMFKTSWHWEKDLYEPIFTMHTYTNKIKVSKNIFNFAEINDEDKQQYKLLDYPEISYYNNLQTILIDNYTDSLKSIDQKYYMYLNSILGKEKEVRLWILLFKNIDKIAGEKQEAYWKGGNMNEFIIMIGINDNYEIQWNRIVSWTTNEELKVIVRNYLSSLSKLELVTLSDWLYPQLKDKFVRRDLTKEFDYLSVEPSSFAIIITYILALLSSVIIAISSVLNDLDASDSQGYNIAFHSFLYKIWNKIQEYWNWFISKIKRN